MRRLVVLVTAATLAMVMVLVISGCTDVSQTDVRTLPAIAKEVSGGGDVALGNLESDGFSLALPADAYAGVADVKATLAPSSGTPEMTNAALLGDGYEVDTGGTGRLDSGATLTYRYDPAATADPMLLALGYYDGSEWTYIPAESVDTTTHTVTFSIYHFSPYYPAEFTSELEAAKYYSGQMAAQKVLGEGGGDPKAASAALADLLASKLGLGEDEFSKRILADIAADQDVLKVFDEAQKEGWTDTGYEYVMDFACGKVADKLIANKSALEAASTAGLSTTEAAFKNMFDVLKVGNSASKFLGLITSGDTTAAGKELFNLATDYTGIPGKALKYTLQGMQNALDVWRDGEVEKAFEVYVNGSSGSLFGYGAVDPKNFDEVWDNMKGSRRQLCIERIRTENAARATLGLAALTPTEEEIYREKVKKELKSEFERRVVLKDKIEAQQKNLDLILDEPYFAQLLEKNNVSLRDKNALNDSLQDRLNRFNHLIERIMTDLQVDTVYSGPQQEGELKGRISSTAMAEMLHGYFVANTEAEAKAFLQEYYKKFSMPGDELVGTWEYTPYYHQQKWTPEGGVSEHEWEWLLAKGPVQFTIARSADSFVLGSGTINVSGNHVRIEYTSDGWSLILEGAVSGDAITGTQSYWDEDAGPLSAQWTATRVK